MKQIPSLRNHAVRPENTEELQALRTGKWQVYQEEATESAMLADQMIQFRAGLTFTPYANPTKCNAHCRFCSEELQRKHQKELTAENVIQNHEEYFTGLAAAFKALSGLKSMGLSLSGLEATSDPLWLLRLLELIGQPEDVPVFNEKVLYTNATGLHKHPDLILALQATHFDRLEISRCHYDDQINQKIMYINRNEAVHQNAPYEALIKKLGDYVPVKNSCILTQIGVNKLSEVEHYLNWAHNLGVKQVVFRELSRLDDSYLENNTKQWVEKHRVPIDPLLQAIMPNLTQTRTDWEYLHSNAGYYYYNEHFLYRGAVEVILETSSYHELRSRTESEVTQKLVFHSNGNLCGDWDPNSAVLANYFTKKTAGAVLS
ncbi:MAG: hypothetical protein AB8G15_04480 [Saprospiraceae bacterium]